MQELGEGAGAGTGGKVAEKNNKRGKPGDILNESSAEERKKALMF